MVPSCCCVLMAPTSRMQCPRSRSSSRANSANPDVDRALTGIPASPGIVVGPVHLLRWEVPDVPNRIVPDDQIEAELERLHAAFEKGRERLKLVGARPDRHAGADDAAIFDVQLTILDDADRLGEIEVLVRQNRSDEKA